MTSDVLKNFSDLEQHFGKVDAIGGESEANKIGEFKLNGDAGKTLKQVVTSFPILIKKNSVVWAKF